MALDTAIDIDAIIYPDNWPTCPAGCQREDDSGPQELDLLVERDTGSVEASVHCALCGLDRPASALGFRAGAAVASTAGRGVVEDGDGWIDASVLPPCDGTYMICLADAEGDEERIWPGLYDGGWYAVDGFPAITVSHWRPMPTPPEGDSI